LTARARNIDISCQLSRELVMLEPRTAANSYVRTLISTVEAQGIAAPRLLQGLPLDEAMLTAANGRIGVDVVHRLWQRALALTHDPELGLKMTAFMRPSSFRVLGLASMTAASLGDALTLVLRYQRLVSEAGTVSAQTQPDGSVSLLYNEQPMRFHLLPQQIEAIIAGMHSQSCWLAGRMLSPLSVSFQHAPQVEPNRYRDYFGIDVQFNAPHNQLQVRAIDLQTPLPQADAELCRLHCQLADQQLASLPQIGFVTGFAAQWLAASASGSVRISDLAQALGMSVRGLQRQLQQEGKSWTLLVDTARRDALAKLLQQGLSLDAAALQLGYHDASSLSRAARRWFGQTPGRWRTAQ
jgi:AraC-like DNA-binding protein